MNKKKIILFVLLILVIVSVAFIMVDIVRVCQYNRELEANFQQKDKYTYVENTDFWLDESLVSIYGQFVFFNYPTEIVLNRDIIYYSEANEDSEILFELKKGETYYISGYPRYVSWPTHDSEWRYALPILKKTAYSGQHTGNDNFIEGDCAYVKTEDLEYILKRCQWELYKMGLSQKLIFKYNDAPLYTIDQILYDKGIYLSSNLYKKSIWFNQTFNR